jgi:hypothetical protein
MKTHVINQSRVTVRNISNYKVIYFLFLVLIFGRVIYFNMGLSLGSSAVLVVSLMVFVLASQRGLVINRILTFFLLITFVIVGIEFFLHHVNPFALSFLSLIYFSIFLVILLKDTPVEKVYKILFWGYATHVIYIFFESILIYIGHTGLLDTISGGMFRQDYNQFNFYFKQNIVNNTAQSLLFMPQAAGSFLLFLFYLIFFHPTIKRSYKIVVQSIILAVFIVFAMNSTAVVIVAFAFVFHYLSSMSVGRIKIRFNFSLLMKISAFILSICLLQFALHILVLKNTYHTHMSANELQETAKSIYLNAFYIYKEQSFLDKVFGIGFDKRAVLLEFGDCAFGNGLLAFGAISIIMLPLFVAYMSAVLFRSLRMVNVGFRRAQISEKQASLMRYLLVSNYALFLGWLMSTAHYPVLFIDSGFMLASFSVVLVLLIFFNLKRQLVVS